MDLLTCMFASRIDVQSHFDMSLSMVACSLYAFVRLVWRAYELALGPCVFRLIYPERTPPPPSSTPSHPFTQGSFHRLAYAYGKSGPGVCASAARGATRSSLQTKQRPNQEKFQRTKVDADTGFRVLTQSIVIQNEPTIINISLHAPLSNILIPSRTTKDLSPLSTIYCLAHIPK